MSRQVSEQQRMLQVADEVTGKSSPLHLFPAVIPLLLTCSALLLIIYALTYRLRFHSNRPSGER